MTPGYDVLVRQSWTIVQPDADALTRRFYERLFEIDPEARALFARTDEAALRRKLVATLEEIVRLVEDPARLVSTIVPLGRRHGEYGVGERDYEAAASALVWALRETLGERCTEEVSDAWRELFVMLGAVMFRSGQKPARAANGPLAGPGAA